MSRFIDQLKRVSLDTAQPMGFKRALSPSKRGLKLVASLAQPDIGDLAERVAGADAVLIPISRGGPGAKTLKKLCQYQADIAWGGWLKGAWREGIKRITAAGFDFVVFTADSAPLAVPEADDLGKILALEVSLDEGLLRAAAELPVGAVLTYGESLKVPFLTWRHLMLFQRFAGLAAKPLLVPVPSEITGNELRLLWEAGIDGVLIEVAAEGKPVGRIKELRQVIDGLSLSPRRQRGRTGALLPRIAAETSETIDEEDESRVSI